MSWHRHDAPGAAVAVVSGGTITASAAAGVADLARGTAMSPEGACNWFSMTKIATATAAMMLVDRGRLDLDAPVSAYLGERVAPRLRGGTGTPSPESQQRAAESDSAPLGSPCGATDAG